MLNKEELESALACAGHCCDCKMPLPDEEFACEHTLAETAIAKQQEIERLQDLLAERNVLLDKQDVELSESRRREQVAVCGMSKKQLTALEGIIDFAKIIKNLDKSPNSKVEIQYAGILADGILKRAKFIREWRGPEGMKNYVEH